MYICTCLNCNRQLEDKNPDPKRSINYPDEPLRSLKQIREAQEIYWACPFCLQDGYLCDNKIEDNGKI